MSFTARLWTAIVGLMLVLIALGMFALAGLGVITLHGILVAVVMFCFGIVLLRGSLRRTEIQN